MFVFFLFVIFPLAKFFKSEIKAAKRFVSCIWKDLRSNPRVLSCFTCLGWLYSFLCTYKPLGCRPPMTLRFFLFSYALHRHLELTFQYDRICQLKALPRRVQNVFWQEWDSNPRTHSCTRILDCGISSAWRFRLLGHPAGFTSTFFCMMCVFPIGLRLHFRDLIC